LRQGSQPFQRVFHTLTARQKRFHLFGGTPRQGGQSLPRISGVPDMGKESVGFLLDTPNQGSQARTKALAA
jgi:hypothetical protein